jgi:hypothetical protein
VILFIVCKTIAFKVIIALIFVLLCAYFLSSKFRKKYNRQKFPGTVNSTIRNYDSIILGKRNVSQEKGKVLDLTNTKRNLYTDIKILQRYYSFSKKSGRVVMCVDYKDKAFLTANVISDFDVTALHEVTLWEYKINKGSKQYKIKSAICDLIFPVCYFFNKISPINRLSKKDYSDKVIYDLRSSLTYVNEFLKERDRKLKVIFYNISPEKFNELSKVLPPFVERLEK